MDNKELIEEIIRSNQILTFQIWVLGGVVVFMMLVVTGLARATWMDAKSMLENHEVRHQISEKNIVRLDSNVENLQGAVSDLKRATQ